MIILFLSLLLSFNLIPKLCLGRPVGSSCFLWQIEAEPLHCISNGTFGTRTRLQIL